MLIAAGSGLGIAMAENGKMAMTRNNHRVSWDIFCMIQMKNTVNVDVTDVWKPLFQKLPLQPIRHG